MIVPSFALLLSWPLLGHAAAVTTVTLNQVQGTNTLQDLVLPSNFYSYSAVGVGSDGLTTYIQELRQSKILNFGGIQSAITVDGMPTSTIVGILTETLDVPTVTYHATLVQGASEYKYVLSPTIASAPPAGEESNCKWGPEGKGECEVKLWGIDAEASTATFTYTGTVAPLYTLIASDIPGQSSGASHMMIGASASIVVMFSTILLMLSVFL